MAKKETVVTVDDIDGTPAVETKKFMLDGVHYKIDLDADNIAHLDDVLRTYVAKARRTGGRATPSKSHAAEKDTSPAAEALPPNEVIRNWARENKHQVADRGRIPEKVIKAYLDATNPRKKGTRKR
ncbi:nucleoid-associated protein Lsr2 [Amycolatopsis sp. WAC 01375]|uniref:histone-like nucleoid-structuring protein Lsr2 n=1 Tax=Amycolatopsis sp. WAC 01375 TaxID=2203194 RepID=UPI000F782878|nr:Lsr2 family protein [Amycolatopsis sp. WAC 01375]RSM68697.1 nucleoid-associated protein Lsr2 [Amycolatopsis sp. WAC 01375]